MTHAVAGLEEQILLAGKDADAAVSLMQRHAEWRAGRATLQAVGRDHASLEHGRERHAVLEHQIRAHHAVAAAVTARAARPGPHPLFVDTDEVFRFDHFDGRVHRVGEVDGARRHAVAVGTRALAAAMGLVEGADRPIAAAAGEDQQARRRSEPPAVNRSGTAGSSARTMASTARWRGLVIAADHRPVDAGIDDRTGPRANDERPVATAVGLDLRPGDGFDRIVELPPWRRKAWC